MTNPAARGLLREILRDVETAASRGERDWDLLIRQGRRSGLLARIAVDLDALGMPPAVAVAEPHLRAERIVAEKHGRDVHREVRRIKAALVETGAPLVFLKGAAYLLADLPPARGRLFTDIDVMVPRTHLAEVESALGRAGWSSGEIAPYDDRYYRRWMHQIPPMTHVSRGTTIDVHHTIVARTTRLDLNAEKLFAAAVPAAADPGLFVLAPTDMVLHSATHLLNEANFDRGLRDLDDLNRLLRHFGRHPAFWPTLLARAAELDLRRPLYYVLRYTRRFLGTPVPEEVAASPELAPPGALLRAFMDELFERALRADHWTARDWLSGTGLWLLYIRAHWLLMPPRILIPHLLRKSVMRWTERKQETVPAVEQRG